MTRRVIAKPLAAHLNDDIFLNDSLETQTKSIAQALFGGAFTATVLESTRYEIRQETLPGGSRRSIFVLQGGKIQVAIAPNLMPSGDQIHVQTPNATGQITGSVLIVEYIASLGRSRFQLVSGSALITPLGQARFPLAPKSEVTITGTSQTGIAVSPVQTVVTEESEFETTVTHKEEPGVEEVAREQDQIAEELLGVIIGEPIPQALKPLDPREVRRISQPKDETQDYAPVPPGGEEDAVEKAVAGSLPFVFDKDLKSGHDPFFTVSSKDIDAPHNMIQVDPDVTVTLGGQLLDVHASDLTAAESFLNVEGSLTGTGDDPFIEIDPTTITVDGSFLSLDGGLELAGPLLSATDDSTLNSAEDFVTVSGSLNSTGTEPLFLFDGGTLIVTETGNFMLVNDTGSVDLAGPLLSMNESSLSAGSGVLSVNGGLTSTSDEPLLDIDDSTVNSDSLLQWSGGAEETVVTGSGVQPFIQIAGGSNVTSNGLVTASGGIANLDGSVLSISDSATTVDTGGVLTLTEAASLSTDSVLLVDQALLEASSALISLQGPSDQMAGITVLETQGPTIDNVAGTITSLGPLVALDKGFINVVDGPLLSLTDGGTLTVTSDLFNLINGSEINILNGPLVLVDGAGSVLDVSGALANFGGTGDNVIIVNNGIDPTLTLSGLPVSEVSGGSILIGPSPVINPALGTIDVTGSLLQASNGGQINITAAGSLPFVFDTDSTYRGEPLFDINSSTIDVPGNANAIVVEPGVDITVEGRLVNITDSTLTVPASDEEFGDFLQVFDASVTSTSNGPLLQFDASTVSVDVSVIDVDYGGSLNLAGPLLRATNQNLIDAEEILFVSEASVTSTSDEALLQFDQSTVSGDVVDVFDGSLDLAGPLLSATNQSSVDSMYQILSVWDGSVTSTSAEPLLQFDDSKVYSYDAVTGVDYGGSLDLAGPLLRATNQSSVDSMYQILSVSNDGSVTSTSDEPLLQFDDSTIDANSDVVDVSSSSVDLAGPLLSVTDGSTVDVSNADVSNAVVRVSDSSSVEVAAPLLSVTNGSTVEAPHVLYLDDSTVESDQQVSTVEAEQVLALDTALLEASGPIIQLIGPTDADAPDSVLTTQGPTIDNVAGTITSVGPVVALDRAFINVQNGPLINLTAGGTLNVTGNLLSLVNGSEINVLNGPLARVDGSGSALNVTGALVNFGGTGGNQIIVNNHIAPTDKLSGLPVSQTTGGSIAIGANPVINPYPGLGNIAVTENGSLIQASNNGVVNIAAP